MAINWGAFTWEAFATLVTGLAAVGAALVVAYRQAGIVERQVKLQEAELRNAVFDRRMDVYHKIRRYLSIVTQPNVYERVKFYKQTIDFIEACNTVEFLFSHEMTVEIEALNQLALIYVEFVSDQLNEKRASIPFAYVIDAPG